MKLTTEQNNEIINTIKDINPIIEQKLYKLNKNYNIAYDDLKQIAHYGVIQAIKNYDRKKSDNKINYILKCIDWKLNNYSKHNADSTCVNNSVLASKIKILYEDTFLEIKKESERISKIASFLNIKEAIVKKFLNIYKFDMEKCTNNILVDTTEKTILDKLNIETIKSNINSILGKRNGQIFLDHVLEKYSFIELSKKYNLCPNQTSYIIKQSKDRLKNSSLIKDYFDKK